MNTPTSQPPRNIDLLYDSYFNKFLTQTNTTVESISNMSSSELEAHVNRFIENNKPSKNDKRTRNNSYSINSKKIILNAIKKKLHNLVSNLSENHKYINLRLSNILVDNQIAKKKLSNDDVNKLNTILKDEYDKSENEKISITKARNIILFNLLIGTGMRVKELLEYKVHQLLDHYIIINRDSNEVIIDNPVDLDLIDKYIKSQELKKDDYIFASGLKRNPLAYEQAYNIIRDIGKKIKFNLSPHSLRAYFISNQIQIGTSEGKINQIVGYRNNSVMIKKIKEDMNDKSQ